VKGVPLRFPASHILEAAVLAAGCAATQKPGAAVPLVDHHQHLLSPAGAELQNRTMPAVELPGGLATLLRDRAERWNDKTGLAGLYAEDAFIHGLEKPDWIRGRAAVAGYLSDRFARAYRLTAVHYRIAGPAAHIGGYYTRGEGPSAKHFGYFSIAAEKGRDGIWRIATETPLFPGPPTEEPETAEQLIALLDAAGLRRAVVLSDAYWFDGPESADPYAKVRAENDWTAQQVARFPDRLVAFCSFNPLRDHALAELDRCASSRRFKGVKLHFRGSGVDLRNPEHVERVRSVFEAANRLRMPIVVHVRADSTYGREHAEVLLARLIAAAPDVPVQIAHLWGGENFSDPALAVYADAVAAGDPRTRNLYFDIAEIALAAGKSDQTLQAIAKRMRQIGLGRMLYGSDGPVPETLTPRQSWESTRTQLPLTEEEFKIVANNVAPYLR
jgi:predicted TIM-barrel fold metal-dependent hydrolase